MGIAYYKILKEGVEDFLRFKVLDGKSYEVLVERLNSEGRSDLVMEMARRKGGG